MNYLAASDFSNNTTHTEYLIGVCMIKYTNVFRFAR